MTMISYAQNGEDVMLMRALGDVAHGFYIDVGAADPTEISVTRAFYDQGWHGVNVEPAPGHFASLVTSRPRDINLQIAIDAADGEQGFHLIAGTGLSTLENAVAERQSAAGWQVSQIVAKTRSLASICEQYAPSTIHFLKVDVEGAEERVLRGADFARYRPWIVVVEATHPGTQDAAYEGWEPTLLEANYRFVWFDGVNRFYIAQEHELALRGAFATPLNDFDGYTVYDPEKERLNAAAASVPVLEAQAQAAQARAAAAEQEAAAALARTAAQAAASEQARTDAVRRADAADATAALLDARMRSSDALAQAAAVNAQAAEAQVGAATARLGDLQHEIAKTRRRHDELRAREEALRQVQSAQHAEATARYALLHHELEGTAAEREQLRQERDALAATRQALAAELAGREATVRALEHEVAELRRPAPAAVPEPVAPAALAAPAPVPRVRLRRRVAMRLYRWSLRPVARPLAWRARSFLLAGIRQVLAEDVRQPAENVLPLLARQTEAIDQLRGRQDRTLEMVHRVDDGYAELRAQQEAGFAEIRVRTERNGEASQRVEAALQVQGRTDHEATRVAASMEAALLTLAMAGRGRKGALP